MTYASPRACHAVCGPLSLALVSIVLSLASPGFAEETVPPAPVPPSRETQAIPEQTGTPVADPLPPTSPELVPPAEPVEEVVTPSVRVSGNIWRMNPGIVFLRTPIGLMTLSCKTCLRNLRGNPTVTLHIHGPAGAVDITPRQAGAPASRYLWGPLAYSDPNKKEAVFWTPDGEKPFMLDKGAAKLAAMPIGRPVTVEVSEAGKVVGVHDLQYDLQVSQLPSHASNIEMTITGSVAKIKNGFVHLKTSLGTLPITGKTGLCQGKDRCRAKVGEDLTLWVHNTSIAIDVHAAGSSTPAVRLLTGKLAYGGPDKKTLSLWTPDGEQSFPTDHARGALASLKEGSPVTVELNGEGAVSDIRKSP